MKSVIARTITACAFAGAIGCGGGSGSVEFEGAGLAGKGGIEIEPPDPCETLEMTLQAAGQAIIDISTGQYDEQLASAGYSKERAVQKIEKLVAELTDTKEQTGCPGSGGD